MSFSILKYRICFTTPGTRKLFLSESDPFPAAWTFHFLIFYDKFHAYLGMSKRLSFNYEPLRCLKIEMCGVMYRSIALCGLVCVFVPLYFHTQDGAPPHTNVKTRLLDGVQWKILPRLTLQEKPVLLSRLFASNR